MNDNVSGKELGLDGFIMSNLGVVHHKSNFIESKKIFGVLVEKLDLGGPRVINYKDIIDIMVPNLNN